MMTKDEELTLLAKMFACACVEQGKAHIVLRFLNTDGIEIGYDEVILVTFDVRKTNHPYVDIFKVNREAVPV